MKHKDLVEIAARWLRNRCHIPSEWGGKVHWAVRRCCPVLTERTSAASETPDAIGWQCGSSVLIECKASLADFRADKEKWFRRRGGMGRYRWFLMPDGLLDNHMEELPEGWGLLYAKGSRVRVVRPPTLQPMNDGGLDNEIRLLVSEMTLIHAACAGKELMPSRRVAEIREMLRGYKDRTEGVTDENRETDSAWQAPTEVGRLAPAHCQRQARRDD